MSVPTSHLSRNSVPPLAIEENSTLLKAISCIPLIGIATSLFQEISLAHKITQVADAPRLIELINVKNQYKVANVVRNLFTAALIVAGIALGIIGGTFAFGAVLTLAHVGMAGLNIYRIHKNSQVVSELQTTGFRTGMQIT